MDTRLPPPRIVVASRDREDAEFLTAQLELSGFRDCIAVTLSERETAAYLRSNRVDAAVVLEDASEAFCRFLDDDTAVPILRRSAFSGVEESFDRVRRRRDLVSSLREQLRFPPPQDVIESGGTLLEERDRYRDLFDRLSDAVLLIDHHTHAIIDANREASRLYDYSREELLGMSLLDLVPEDEHPSLLENTRALERGETLRIGRRTHLRRDGTPLSVSVSATLIQFGGRTVFQDVIRDETARRRAEEAAARDFREQHDRLAHATRALGEVSIDRERTRAVLKTAERRYVDLVDNLPCMVACVDTTGHLIECNATLTAETGFARDEILGRPVVELYSEACRIDVERAYETFLRTGLVKDAQLEMKCRDGRVLDVVLNVTAFRDDDGNIVYSRSAIQDVSDLKRLERNLFRAQKLDAIGTLATGVAHDFNNCLLAIMGNAQLAGDVSRNSTVQKHLCDILSACNTAASLSRSLLALGRPSDGEGVSPTRLDVLLGVTQRLLRRLIPKAIALEVDCGRVPIWANADASQLQQVIINLAVNARDAMPRGGRVSIRLREETDDVAVITVEDTGCGIEADRLEQIFEPFSTSKPRGKGTGLGLSIVQSVVTSHGGSVQIDSRFGEGTVVRVLLPTCPAPASPSGSSPSSGEGSDSEERFTVLVAEDDALVRKSLVSCLIREGFDVIQAEDGVRTVSEFERNRGRIDLCIIDVDLPRLRGPECLRRIRSLDRTARAILASGLPLLDDEDVVSDELTVYLAKPFSPSELIAEVRKILGAC